jgi:hypothetical protein
VDQLTCSSKDTDEALDPLPPLGLALFALDPGGPTTVTSFISVVVFRLVLRLGVPFTEPDSDSKPLKDTSLPASLSPSSLSSSSFANANNSSFVYTRPDLLDLRGVNVITSSSFSEASDVQKRSSLLPKLFAADFECLLAFAADLDGDPMLARLEAACITSFFKGVPLFKAA